MIVPLLTIAKERNNGGRQGPAQRLGEDEIQSRVENFEAAAHAKAHPAGVAVKNRAPRDPNIAAFEKELGMALGMKIAIRAKDAGPDGWRGGGELTIHYRTLDQLDDLVRRLKVPAKR